MKRYVILDCAVQVSLNAAFLPQLGLEVKTKHAEELTETVEVVEEVDDEEQIQNEVRPQTIIPLF